jgi:hypothetical protein
VAKIAQQLKGRIPKKKNCFPYKILDILFFN